MERHDTHALSDNSSSSNHSYQFDDKNKANRKSYQKNFMNDGNINKQLNNQIKKINELLNKYNINSEKIQKRRSSMKNIKRNRNRNSLQEEIKPQYFKSSFNNNNNNIDNDYYTSSNKDKEGKYIFNEIQTKNSVIDREDRKNDDSNKNRDSFIKGNAINDNDPIIKENKEIKNNNDLDKKPNKKDMLIYSLTYKNVSRETRFNNIKKNNDDKIKKIDEKHKLLIYHQVYKSHNLIREIEKPGRSFITKISKLIYRNPSFEDLSENPKLSLTVKNNFCFFTKQYVNTKTYKREINSKTYKKEIKLNNYQNQKFKKEADDEKIPSFSSIESSSSDTYSKPKSKTRKLEKNKVKIKSNNISKKKAKLYNYKSFKGQKSLSIKSKLSKDKSDETKKNIAKKKKNIKNYKKKLNNITDRKLNGININIRKNSLGNKYYEKINNLENEIDNKYEKIKMKNKNLKDIEFKKFLEEEQAKRKAQIINYIKKSGINSYNFFYPKELSPLFSTFKNKYTIYPTLNVNRKNSIEIGAHNNVIVNSKQYSIIKSNLQNDNSSMIEFKDNPHIIERHYGIEKDCPLCRAFQMRKLKNKNRSSINYNKLMRYKNSIITNKNASIGEIGSARIKTPKIFNFVNPNNEISALSINRTKKNYSIQKNEYIDEFPFFKENAILNDYLNQ